MSLTGEEVAAAYRKWLENEVGLLAASRADVGKFFFGVSTATLGFFLALDKRGLTAQLDRYTLLSLILLFASMLGSILLVIPIHWRIDSATDLFTEHRLQLGKLTMLIWLWLGCWSFGTAVWIFRLLS